MSTSTRVRVVLDFKNRTDTSSVCFMGVCGCWPRVQGLRVEEGERGRGRDATNIAPGSTNISISKILVVLARFGQRVRAVFLIVGAQPPRGGGEVLVYLAREFFVKTMREAYVFKVICNN